MDSLRNQNAQLQRSVEAYLEEIEKQKDMNQQHEHEIETLLKFNERLLGIIENQLNNPKRDNVSLQPISERSERQSDMMAPTIQSFVRTRKLGPQSQRGCPTSNSLVERAQFNGSRLDSYGRDVQKSQVNHSVSHEGSEYRGEVSRLGRQAAKAIAESSEVRKEMTREISELKKFKQQSSKFYDNKISQIRNLSSKLNNYKPMDQINQITSKLTLSANTTNLIKNAILRSTQ